MSGIGGRSLSTTRPCFCYVSQCDDNTQRGGGDSRLLRVPNEPCASVDWQIALGMSLWTAIGQPSDNFFIQSLRLHLLNEQT
jgi:hypothetical protein